MMTLEIQLTGKDAHQALEMIRRRGGRIMNVVTMAEGGNGETIYYQTSNGDFCSVGTVSPSFSGVHGESADPIENYTAKLCELLKALREHGVPLGHAVEDLVVA